jgi:hypothetical protein
MQGYLVPLAPITSEQAVNGQVTHWTPSYIEDVFYIEMCEAEIADPNNPDEKISRYYLEAGKYAGRISVGNFDGANEKHKPVFELHYDDFTTRIQEELKLLLQTSPDTVKTIVKNAVFRIFKARHKQIFFEYIQSEGLNWRFVAD